MCFRAYEGRALAPSHVVCVMRRVCSARVCGARFGHDVMVPATRDGVRAESDRVLVCVGGCVWEARKFCVLSPPNTKVCACTRRGTYTRRGVMTKVHYCTRVTRYSFFVLRVMVRPVAAWMRRHTPFDIVQRSKDAWRIKPKCAPPSPLRRIGDTKRKRTLFAKLKPGDTS